MYNLNNIVMNCKGYLVNLIGEIIARRLFKIFFAGSPKGETALESRFTTCAGSRLLQDCIVFLSFFVEKSIDYN